MIGALCMDKLNIRNGILAYQMENYSIYEMYTDEADQYYLCIAKNQTNNYKVVIDFPEVYFNDLLKEDKLTEIRNTCDKLYENNYQYIYILPNVTTQELKEAKTENDNHAYQVLLRKLQKYTYDVFKSLTSNMGKIIIDKKINIIVGSDDDKKFIDFLDINLNGYFAPMYLEHEKVKIEENNDVPIEYISNNENTVTVKNEEKTRKLTPANKQGFLTVTSMAMIITIAAVAGVAVAYLLVK